VISALWAVVLVVPPGPGAASVGDPTGILCLLGGVVVAGVMRSVWKENKRNTVRELNELEHDWFGVVYNDGRRTRVHWEGHELRRCLIYENGTSFYRDTTCAKILNQEGEFEFGWREVHLAKQVEEYRERQARLRRAGPIPRFPDETPEVPDVLVEVDKLKEALTPPKKPAP